jgi:hypothetical protein
MTKINKDKVIGLKSTYVNNEDHKTMFEFNDKLIGISSSLTAILDESKIVNLLKTLTLPSNDYKVNSTHELSVTLNSPNFDVQEYYSPEKRKEMGDDHPIVEKLNAIDFVKSAAEILSKFNNKEASESFESAKWKNQELKKMMDSLRVNLIEADPDKSFINKQKETVFQREILLDGNNIGAIEYLEDNDSVTILRSDVEEEHQGKGIGFKAYSKLVDDKIALGKSIGSDSIVSLQAQAIYRKLQDAGHKTKSPFTRLMLRGKITSLFREDSIAQRKAFPSVIIDGVGVTDSGYRFKGPSIFKISPESSLNPPPVINIREENLLLGLCTNTYVYPSYVQSERVSQSVSFFSTDVFNEIESLLNKARDVLIHPENSEIRDSLVMDNVIIKDVVAVSYDDISKSVELDFAHENAGCTI